MSGANDEYNEKIKKCSISWNGATGAPATSLLIEHFLLFKFFSCRNPYIIATGNSLEYSGDLQFKIDSRKLIRAVKPISIPIIVKVKGTDPVNAKTITQCCIGNNCQAPAVPTTGTVTISCVAGNNSSNTCVINIVNALSLASQNITGSQIHLMSCYIQSYFDNGHNWQGHPYNNLTYDPATSNLYLSVNQAGVTVNVSLDWGASAISGLSNAGFSCP